MPASILINIGSAFKVLLGSLIVMLAFAFTTLASTPLDFDGDGKTDYALVRDNGTNWVWYILTSSDSTLLAIPWGVTPSPDSLIPGDYDGDGIWDITVTRTVSGNNHFFILKSSSGFLSYDNVTWGLNGDNVFESQDFDGDGKVDPTAIRNVDGSMVWYIKKSNGSGTDSITWGYPSDLLIRGNFDNDAKADVAVCRLESGVYTFYIRRSTDGNLQTQTLGTSGDAVVQADFDGDGKTDYAVYRTTGTLAGTWYWVLTSDMDHNVHSMLFGQSTTTDYPAPGDYDGDGITDHTVRRRTGEDYPGFYVKKSTNGNTTFQAMGLIGDNVLSTTVQVR